MGRDAHAADKGVEAVIEDTPSSATWAKYCVVAKFVASLSMKDRRFAFTCMRQQPSCTTDTLVPALGLTAGEFCIFHTLCQSRARARRPAPGGRVDVAAQ